MFLFEYLIAPFSSGTGTYCWSFQFGKHLLYELNITMPPFCARIEVGFDRVSLFSKGTLFNILFAAFEAD
jgi:hypothetical protein